MKRIFCISETKKCSNCSNRSFWKVLWERFKIGGVDAITDLPPTWQRFQLFILKIKEHQNHQKNLCNPSPFEFRTQKYHFSRHRETWSMKALYLSFRRITIITPFDLLFSKTANNRCSASSRSITHSRKLSTQKVPRRRIIINKCGGIIKVGLCSRRPSTSMSSRREGQ